MRNIFTLLIILIAFVTISVSQSQSENDDNDNVNEEVNDSSSTVIDNSSTTYTATPTSITLTTSSTTIPTQTLIPIDDNNDDNNNADNENDDDNNDNGNNDDDMPLDIKITPAFGVIGAILIITGILVAVLGATSRWTSACIPSSYAAMIALMCILLSTVVLPKKNSMNPDKLTPALEGEILVGCAILGIIVAVLSWWFQKFIAFGVCGFGGMALGWWIQCMRDGGVIHSMAGKWIFYIGLGTVCVVAGFHPKVMPHLLRFSTSLIGSTAFILGVDCFVKSGLKEFYVYNLGYSDLYTPIEPEKFPLTQTEIILLAVTAATTLLSLALQYRLAILAGRKAKIVRDEEQARDMGLDPNDDDLDSLELKRNKRRDDARSAWEYQHAPKGAIAAAKYAITNGIFNKSSTPINTSFENNNEHSPNSMEKDSYDYNKKSIQNERKSSSPPPSLPPTTHQTLPPSSPPPLLPPLSTLQSETQSQPPPPTLPLPSTDNENEQHQFNNNDRDHAHEANVETEKPSQKDGPLPVLDLGFGSEMRSELGLPIEDEKPSPPPTPPRPTSQKRNRAPSAPTLLDRKAYEKANEELKQKENLLNDIANIRRSIDELRSKSTDNLRLQNEHEKSKSVSMERLQSVNSQKSKKMKSQSTQSFAKFNSNDDNEENEKLNEWEQYVRSRRLYAPPSGPSKKINEDDSIEVSPAVAVAIEKRRLKPELTTSVYSNNQQIPSRIFANSNSNRNDNNSNNNRVSEQHIYNDDDNDENNVVNDDKLIDAIPYEMNMRRLSNQQQPSRPSVSRLSSYEGNVIGSMASTRTPLTMMNSKFDNNNNHSPSSRTRSMTVEELQARHRRHLSKLQSPVNEQFERDRKFQDYQLRQSQLSQLSQLRR